MSVAPPSPPYRGPAPHQGGRTNRPITRIVIHCTAGTEPGVPGAADSTIAFTKSSGVVSSYHYVRDSEVARQLVYDGEVAFHCGYNYNSIGYELCCSLSNEGGILVKAAAGVKALTHWQTPAHKKMLRDAAEDVARLCINEGVPIRKLTVAQVRAHEKGICGHVDVRDAFPGYTTHWDPGPFFPWRRFIRLTRRAAKRLVAPPPAPAPKPDPTPPAPPPVSAPVEPHDPFTVALLPGKWNAPLTAWRERIDEAIGEGSDLVVLTETTRESIATGLKQIPGWDSNRDPAAGPSNIMALWDPDRFELASDPYSYKLDETQVWSKTGFARPQTFARVYPLRDILADDVFLLVAGHLPLENTPNREKAKAEAIATLDSSKVLEQARLLHPHAVRLYAFDWNRRSSSSAVRDWFSKTWPTLTPAWGVGVDWQAAGKALQKQKGWVLPRKKGDALDHHTNLVTWAWVR